MVKPIRMTPQPGECVVEQGRVGSRPNKGFPYWGPHAGGEGRPIAEGPRASHVDGMLKGVQEQVKSAAQISLIEGRFRVETSIAPIGRRGGTSFLRGWIAPRPTPTPVCRNGGLR